MKIRAYSYTNQGGRSHNEDSIRCYTKGRQGVFVLADGLGGHLSGEVASGIAVDTISMGCVGNVIETEHMLKLFFQANERIMEEQRGAAHTGMKTTAVALSIDEKLAVWAHIGDSRLYHFSNGGVSQLTQDHSVTYRKYLSGEISYMDINHDDDRSSLLQVLGKDTCKPEADKAAINAGDAFLLCSDGFWEYVYKEEMLIDWLKSKTPEQWGQLMLLRLVRRVPAKHDNFSLITVFLEDEL